MRYTRGHTRQRSVKVTKTVDITPDKYFYSNDGQVFKTVRELADGINNMSDETFAYHCNTEKNDFRNWVIDVLNRTKLAKLLKRVKNKDQFKTAINLYLTHMVKSVLLKKDETENTEAENKSAQ